MRDVLESSRENRSMTIDDVSLTLFRWSNIPAAAYHNVGTTTQESMLGLLTIKTSDGVEGHAFIGGSTHPASLDGPALIHVLKPLLLGRNPLDREFIYHLIHAQTRAVSYRCIGAVDVALWDIAGKMAGLPIHRLLGTYRTSIPAYASSQMFQHAEQYREDAVKFRDAGWQAYKIHPPRRAAADIRVCEAVREAVGDDYALMLDSTWAYGYEDALRVGRAIERQGYLWFEDPLGARDIYNYVKLREKLDIPIMATEMPEGGFDSYAIWITEKATDFLRGDVFLKGGITTMVKTAHLAEAFNLGYEIHIGGNSLNDLAGLHVAMAIRNCRYFEVLMPATAHRYGVIEDIEVGADGMVKAPEGPGLGAKIDFELIKRMTETVLR
jgi:L-alanine-DL-glutamate epimerase-like enolase superfamily enzyme